MMSIMPKILPFLIFFLPFSPALNPTEGIDLSIIRLFPFLLFGLWLTNGLQKQKLTFDKKPVFWLWLLFLIFTSISFLWAENPIWSLRKSLFLVSFLPFYLFSFSFYAQPNPSFSSHSLFKAFFASATLSALIGLVQFGSALFFSIETTLSFWQKIQVFFLGKTFASVTQNFPSFLVNINGQNFLRAFGTFPDPHLFGAFLALSFPFGVYFYQKKPSLLWFCSLFLIFLALLLSFSRTAYFMFAGEGIFLLLFFFKKPTLLKMLFFLFFFCLPLFFLVNNPWKERLLTSFHFQEGSISGRLIMWEKAFQAFQTKPWIGVGLGNFPLFVKEDALLREPIYAHNLFLDFLAETGIFSLFLLLLIFFLPILQNLFFFSNSKKILAIFFVGFLLYALFEAPFFSLQLYPLFLVFLAL